MAYVRPLASAKPADVSEPPPAAKKSPYKLVQRAERMDTVVHIGQLEVGGDRPILIAGPCSVESAEQVAACAAAVRAGGSHVLRGGCFKPRTSPYSFQGLGYPGAWSYWPQPSTSWLTAIRK